MYIHEAIAARTRREPFVTREAWQYVVIKNDGRPPGCPIKLNPTDSPDLCIVLSETSGTTCGWRPSLEDLIADDWLAVQ